MSNINESSIGLSLDVGWVSDVPCTFDGCSSDFRWNCLGCSMLDKVPLDFRWVFAGGPRFSEL